MEIKNTQKDYENVASMFMLVYGAGGVGKTTFASTFPKPLLIDFENGAKYFKQRGIDIDVAPMDKWFTRDDIEQLQELIANYDTIVIDPIGEAMEKLMKSEHLNNTKWKQADGSPTMAGWGKIKDDFRWLVKFLRDTNKNIVLVAHVAEGKDNDSIIKRPKISANMADEISAMVDTVGYMDIVTVDGEDKRVIRTQPTERYYAKDRSGTLPAYVKPDYKYIHDLVNGKTTADDGEKKTAKKTTSKKTTKK
jgi:phage nucleotide-binding protein